MSRPKISTQDFIDKANIVHNYKFDYSITEYLGWNKKLKVICPLHGEFVQEASSHLIKNTYACKKCSKIAMVETNIKKYGRKAAWATPEALEKSKATYFNKHGVNTPFENKNIQQRIININQEKFGVDYPFQSTEFQNQIDDMMIKRIGHDYRKQLQEASRSENQVRYGVDYPNQNPEILEKQERYKRKPFIFPCGANITYQGYENYAFMELLSNGYTREDIKLRSSEGRPTIRYKDKNGKLRCHFPDIFIPSINLLIEVKSPWTFNINNDKIMLNQEESKKQGYRYEIWIINPKNQKDFQLLVLD